jgi:hypothetical protein
MMILNNMSSVRQIAARTENKVAEQAPPPCRKESYLIVSTAIFCYHFLSEGSLTTVPTLSRPSTERNTTYEYD